MGEVWRATHLGLGSPVALKLIDPTLFAGRERKELATRFEREARAAASLQSNHVVKVTDHGTDERGTPYMAMELLQGESLEARLARDRRLSPATTLTVLTQIGRAMSQAHELGIVHRDLKPENVFIAARRRARDGQGARLRHRQDHAIAARHRYRLDDERTADGDALLHEPGASVGIAGRRSPFRFVGDGGDLVRVPDRSAAFPLREFRRSGALDLHPTATGSFFGRARSPGLLRSLVGASGRARSFRSLPVSVGALRVAPRSPRRRSVRRQRAACTHRARGGRCARSRAHVGRDGRRRIARADEAKHPGRPLRRGCGDRLLGRGLHRVPLHAERRDPFVRTVGQHRNSNRPRADQRRIPAGACSHARCRAQRKRADERGVRSGDFGERGSYGAADCERDATAASVVRARDDDAPGRTATNPFH